MPNGNIGHRLMKAEYQDLTVETIMTDHASHGGISREQAKRLVEQMKRETIYKNDLYQVAVNKELSHGFAGFVIWELSIKRTDKEALLDWRDIMTIKNQLCGPNAEGFMLLPAEERLVDTANQFYCYILMKGPGGRLPRFPIGFGVRTVSEDTPGMGKQRPFDKSVVVPEKGILEDDE